jgi:hypothetical protein
MEKTTKAAARNKVDGNREHPPRVEETDIDS